MSGLGRRFGVMAVAGLSLSGCMSGRSALLATQAPRSGSAFLTAPDALGSPIGGAYPVGPSRTSGRALASSGSGSARVALGVRATTASVGALKVSSGLSAGVAPVGLSGRAGVAITPTLAPASSVGASVAAVAQPLNVAATARVRTRLGLKPVVKGLAAKPPTGLGLSLHAGG